MESPCRRLLNETMTPRTVCLFFPVPCSCLSIACVTIENNLDRHTPYFFPVFTHGTLLAMVVKSEIENRQCLLARHGC